MPRASSAAGLGVMVLVGCAAPPPPRPPVDPATLVGQLDDPQLRIAAANALVAQGGAAVAPLLAELERAIEGRRAPRQREALRLLRALGPQGGTALPPLLALSPRLDLSAGHELVRTVAELAPYRPPSLSIDESAVGESWHRDAPETALELRRLRVRLWSATDGDLPALLAMASEPDAFRIELAIEQLARMGASASSALPVLAAVLDRSDPRVTTTSLRVPLRARAANAILRIAPEHDLGRRARAVIAGTDPEPGPLPPPDRVLGQIESLLVAFATAEQRELAATHLVALGPDGSRALLQAVTGSRRDPTAYAHALAVTGESASTLAELVPGLVALLAGLPAADHRQVLDALTRAVPYTRDVLVLPRGRTRDRTLQADLHAAYDRLQAELDLPAWLPDNAVAKLTVVGSLAAVQRAASLLGSRGVAARATLPTLARALRRRYRTQGVVLASGEVLISEAGFDDTRARVAQAILAIADASDPLTAEARSVLERRR